MIGVVLSSPLIIVILIVLQVHRQIVKALLVIRYGASFRGLLEGMDVVWAVQSNSSKAMANVLLLFDMKSSTNASNEISLTLRKRMEHHLKGTVYEKMFWQRCLQWGYYFWLQDHKVSFDHHIRQLDTLPNMKAVSRKDLCRLIGSMSTQECKGNASWEILIGKQPVYYRQGNASMVPVIFRYHHSIADGVAMFRLLCNDFLDNDQVAMHQFEHGDVATTFHPDKDSQLPIMPTVGWRKLWQVFFTAPRFLIHEIFFKREANIFYGPKPSERKVTYWVREDSNAELDMIIPSMIKTIKKVKGLMKGCSFTDVFLLAFAMSLRNHCKRKKTNIPFLTISIMRRFERESKIVRLYNRSSPVFQTLPIGCLPVPNSPRNTLELLAQLYSMKKESDAVLSSGNALTTYWSLSYLPVLLPVPVMRIIFARSKFSIAFSNIPALEKNVSVGGFDLLDACFWVPNIEGNLFGLTVLTTNGRLQIGAIADHLIIGGEEELENILNDTISELQNYAKLLS
uniref:O-acyltransferase WSD1 C-terminal domain-containing protein n=1 Tax=Anopheles darlingi TaxID=43151 RepID=A0A2K6VB74_ANODA